MNLKLFKNANFGKSVIIQPRLSNDRDDQNVNVCSMYKINWKGEKTCYLETIYLWQNSLVEVNGNLKEQNETRDGKELNYIRGKTEYTGYDFRER